MTKVSPRCGFANETHQALSAYLTKVSPRCGFTKIT